MNPRARHLLLALIGLGVCLFGLARQKAVRQARLAAAALPSTETEKHKVTPDMLAAAVDHARTSAPNFHVADADGTMRDLPDLLKSGPVVLVFIKYGCPCSVTAGAYLNRLFALYGGHLRIIGVINGDAGLARLWASDNRVPFPILPDPDLAITRAYGATNSAFVALIDPQGRIDELWPGYAAKMLDELNRRASRMAGLTEEAFDTSEAPGELYSGCPFGL